MVPLVGPSTPRITPKGRNIPHAAANFTETASESGEGSSSFEGFSDSEQNFMSHSNSNSDNEASNDNGSYKCSDSCFDSDYSSDLDDDNDEEDDGMAALRKEHDEFEAEFKVLRAKLEDAISKNPNRNPQSAQGAKLVKIKHHVKNLGLLARDTGRRRLQFCLLGCVFS